MNILIIEDEKKTALILKEMIEFNQDCLVVKILDSIEDSVNYLQKHKEKLDLIFMDIQLADGQSFEIFGLVQINIPVIFCTAYDDYVLKAFKNNGIDYILKPFKEQDILNALAKLEKLKSNFIQSSNSNSKFVNMLESKQNYHISFLVRLRDKMIPLLITNIALAYYDNEIVYLYNFKGEKYTIFKTLDQFESSVPSTQFYRVNRQTIVNRETIKEIEPYFNKKVSVQLTIPFSEKIVVSRLKVTSFLEWIEYPH